jgi:hypothetical protein
LVVLLIGLLLPSAVFIISKEILSQAMQRSPSVACLRIWAGVSVGCILISNGWSGSVMWRNRDDANRRIDLLLPDRPPPAAATAAAALVAAAATLAAGEIAGVSVGGAVVAVVVSVAMLVAVQAPEVAAVVPVALEGLLEVLVSNAGPKFSSCHC